MIYLKVWLIGQTFLFLYIVNKLFFKMASQVSHLPHISNAQAGIEHWDPMHNSLFQINFTVPYVMQGEYNQDELLILSQQVISVNGLDQIQKPLSMYTMKYLGVDVAFFNPMIDNTSIDFNIVFNLNIRNQSDAYVFKLFKSWLRLIYNMSTGVVPLLGQCRAESMTICEANRDGTIWRQVVMKNVVITGMTGMDSLDYSSSEPRTLTVTFHGDYWDETTA